MSRKDDNKPMQLGQTVIWFSLGSEAQDPIFPGQGKLSSVNPNLLQTYMLSTVPGLVHTPG